MANIDNIRYILSRKINYLIPKKVIEELFIKEIKKYSEEKNVEYVIDTMLNDLNNDLFYKLAGIHFYLSSFNNYYDSNCYGTKEYKHIPSYNNVEFYLSKENFKKMIDERNKLCGYIPLINNNNDSDIDSDDTISKILYEMIEEELINNEYNYNDYIIAGKKYIIDCVLREFENDKNYHPEHREIYIRYGYELLKVIDTNEFNIYKEEKEEFSKICDDLKLY